MDHDPGASIELVDWDLAAATARRLSRPGPVLTPADAEAVVDQLRRLAAEAYDHVTTYTGMTADPALRTSTAVVDRAAWSRANVDGLRLMLAPLLAMLAERRAARPGRGAHAVTAVGRRISGVEVGTVLAFLAHRVLGQYEVFVPSEVGDGRLSLVAPNIVETERRLDVDPRDFRMWVCVHEQTHHVQFTGVPWLKPHLADLVARLAAASDLDPQAVLARLRGALTERRHGRGDDAAPGGPLAILQTPEQRALFGEVQSLMTLLEGHADHVMDAVGPQVVPSVAVIRRRFEERRRRGVSPIDRLLRRVLGLDAKLLQYRVGGAFCRAVATAAGPDALRQAFASPEQLPTSAELRDPPAWLARVVTQRGRVGR